MKPTLQYLVRGSEAVNNALDLVGTSRDVVVWPVRVDY